MNLIIREEIAASIRKTDCWELADKLAGIACEVFEKRIDSLKLKKEGNGRADWVDALNRVKEELSSK